MMMSDLSLPQQQLPIKCVRATLPQLVDSHALPPQSYSAAVSNLAPCSLDGMPNRTVRRSFSFPPKHCSPEEDEANTSHNTHNYTRTSGGWIVSDHTSSASTIQIPPAVQQHRSIRSAVKTGSPSTSSFCQPVPYYSQHQGVHTKYLDGSNGGGVPYSTGPVMYRYYQHELPPGASAHAPLEPVIYSRPLDSTIYSRPTPLDSAIYSRSSTEQPILHSSRPVVNNYIDRWTSSPVVPMRQQYHHPHHHPYHHPVNTRPGLVPWLTATTYVQAEIFPKAVEHHENTRTTDDSCAPLQINENTLDKFLQMPGKLQSKMIKLLAQQNEIRLLELQSNQKTKTLASKDLSTVSTTSPASSRSDGLDLLSPTHRLLSDKEQQQHSSASLLLSHPQQIVGMAFRRDGGMSELQQQGLPAMSSMQDPLDDRVRPVTPTVEPQGIKEGRSGQDNHRPKNNRSPRLNQPRIMMGLEEGEVITLEKIKAVNLENLKLASNLHLSKTMCNSSKPLESRAGGLPFADIESTKQKLMALNPNWTGTPEELLAAMEAHSAGRSVRFTSETQTGSVEPQAGAGQQEKRVVDHDGFQNVCHIQTHSLEIDFLGDGGTNQYPSREVPVVLIYLDPPVYVISEFLCPQECQAILTLTQPHWSWIDERCATTSSTEERLQLSRIKGTAKLPWGKSELVDRLLRRAAAVCEVGTDDFEELFILRYQQNETSEEHLEKSGRRSTLLVYLNELVSGGETDFPHLGFQIRPQTGTAVLWHNVKVETVDPVTRKLRFHDAEKETRMLHASMPVHGDEVKFVLVFYTKERCDE